MLCVIVRIVVCTLVPIEEQLLLCGSIAEPIEPHVPSFRSFLTNVCVYEGTGCGIIGLNGGKWLGMVQGFKSSADRNGNLTVAKDTSCFDLSGRGNN